MDLVREEWNPVRKLGEGAFGVVYEAVHRRTDARVAIKVIKPNEDNGIDATSLREVSILKQMADQPHIVRLLDVRVRDASLILVLEMCDSDLTQALRGYVSQGKRLPGAKVRKYTSDLLHGVDCLHSHGVFHRDLKPHNLLVVATDDVLKIGDLGLARAFSVPCRTYTHEVCTLWYRPPEVLLGLRRYSCAIDMWSVGTVVAEMSSGRPLLTGDSEIDQLYRIFRLFGTPAEGTYLASLSEYRSTFPSWRPRALRGVFAAEEVTDECVDLMARCLEYDPATRLTARDALRHPFVAQVRADALGEKAEEEGEVETKKRQRRHSAPG